MMVLAKMALQYLQRYLELKDSGVVAPSQWYSRRKTYCDVGKVRAIEGGGLVRKSIRTDRMMLYGMIQNKLMSPSRTSVLDDMVESVAVNLH
jgi:hypothetical protein